MPDSGDLLSCSFCGSNQKQVKNLIVGPHAYICDGCVSRAHAVLVGNDQAAKTSIATIQQVDDDAGAAHCSFCGKHRHQVGAMASAGDRIICDECLKLCDEILIARQASPDGPPGG